MIYVYRALWILILILILSLAGIMKIIYISIYLSIYVIWILTKESFINKYVYNKQFFYTIYEIELILNTICNVDRRTINVGLCILHITGCAAILYLCDSFTFYNC